MLCVCVCVCVCVLCMLCVLCVMCCVVCVVCIFACVRILHWTSDSYISFYVNIILSLGEDFLGNTD